MKTPITFNYSNSGLTKKHILIGNRLIANFLGYTYFEELDYHESWNDLMKLWIKICPLTSFINYIGVEEKCCRIYSDSCSIVIRDISEGFNYTKDYYYAPDLFNRYYQCVLKDVENYRESLMLCVWQIIIDFIEYYNNKSCGE